MTLQKNVLQIQIIMHSRIFMKLIEVYNCDESIVVSNKTERRIVLPIKISGPFELLKACNRPSRLLNMYCTLSPALILTKNVSKRL